MDAVFAAGEPSDYGSFNTLLPMDKRILLGLVRHHQVKRLLELGVCRGETASFLLREAPCIQEYVGVDVTPGFRTILESQQPEVPLIAGEFALQDPRFKVVLFDIGTVALLDDEPSVGAEFDLCFVDADHSYDGVARDTMIAERMVGPGGIIVWHDYKDEPGTGLGVKRFVDEYNRENGYTVSHVRGSWLCFMQQKGRRPC
jgi:predicted O-methyltransferase YrrM